MEKFIFFLAKGIIFALTKFLFRTEITGKKNVPKKGPFIMAPNHVSFLDALILGSSAPRKLYYFAKNSLFEKRLLADLITILGAIPAEHKIMSFALRKGIRILKQKKGILIFPEGTRSKNGKMGTGKPGIGFLAVKSKCPVIPVFISGTNKAFPVGGKFLKPAKVKIIIGKPIFFNQEDSYVATLQIMEKIKELQSKKQL